MDLGASKNYFEKYSKDVKDNILVMNQSGEIIFDSSNQFYGGKYPHLDKIKNSGQFINLNGKDTLFYTFRESNNGFIVVGLITKDELFKDISVISRAAYVILFFCALIGIFFIYINSKLLSTRVQ